MRVLPIYIHIIYIYNILYTVYFSGTPICTFPGNQHHRCGRVGRGLRLAGLCAPRASTSRPKYTNTGGVLPLFHDLLDPTVVSGHGRPSRPFCHTKRIGWWSVAGPRWVRGGPGMVCDEC